MNGKPAKTQNSHSNRAACFVLSVVRVGQMCGQTARLFSSFLSPSGPNNFHFYFLAFRALQPRTPTTRNAIFAIFLLPFCFLAYYSTPLWVLIDGSSIVGHTAMMLYPRSASGAFWTQAQSCRVIVGRRGSAAAPGFSTMIRRMLVPRSIHSPAQMAARIIVCRLPGRVLKKSGRWHVGGVRSFSTTPVSIIETQQQQLQQSSSFYSAEQKQVMDQCKQLHSSIMELNERVSVVEILKAQDALHFC